MALYNYITGSGVIVPDTSELLATVEAEFKAVFGDDLITTPDTPEGLLIAAEVSARDAVIRNNAALANQINPNQAGGVFIDALWALMGGERVETTASTAAVQVTGVVGTIVNTSVRFTASAGSTWAVTAETVIGAEGTAVVPVVCTTPGPVSAAAGTITQIAIGALGLETVTNADAATLGTLSQSDLSARRARKQQLGRQGVTLPAAIKASLHALENVKSLTFRENITDAIAVIDGVTMVPHSIYVCVDGGSDEDVATTLLGKKSLGSNWNGSTEVAVTDPSSGQPYTVKFARPALVPVLARVTVKVTNPLINPQTAVRTAILAYANGEQEGEDGLTVGESVSPFEFSAAINNDEPGIYVKNLEVATVSGGVFDVTTIPIAIFEKATITAAAIQVLIVT